MAEAAAAAPAAGVTNGQSQAAPSGNGSGKAAPNPGSAGKAPAHDASKAAAGSPGAAAAAAQAEAEELEEIKLGGASAKLPKAFAKIVKDLERGFHGKAQEAAQIRKQVEGFVKQAKENPEWFFQQTGIDPDQFSEARLARKLQEQMMTPEQRRLRDLEQENAKYKETESQRKAREAKEKEEADYQREAASVRAEAGKAIGKSELLSNDPYLAARCFAIKDAYENAGRDLTWEEAVSKVESEFIQSLKKRASSLTPEQLEELIGETGLKGWREFDLARVTERSASGSKSASKDSRPGGQPASQRKPKGPMSEKEYRDYWAQKVAQHDK